MKKAHELAAKLRHESESESRGVLYSTAKNSAKMLIELSHQRKILLEALEKISDIDPDDVSMFHDIANEAIKKVGF